MTFVLNHLKNPLLYLYFILNIDMEGEKNRFMFVNVLFS